jgi:protein-S-isoprenylcysteine O-methyltransferase Ste14
MIRRLVAAIVILPGTVLVLVSAAIVWLSQNTSFAPRPAAFGGPRFWPATMALTAGLGLAVWTCRLFVTAGEGTPAPWDPPQRLVVRGPFRHVRNPMITSVLLMLLGEALYLWSWPVSLWLLVFFVANAIYFPFGEEKGLERRFGDQYRDYRNNVPRWIPRLTPWQQSC